MRISLVALVALAGAAFSCGTKEEPGANRMQYWFVNSKVKSSLNARAQPGTDAQVITRLRSGTLVRGEPSRVHKGPGYTWRRIVVERKKVWVAARFLTGPFSTRAAAKKAALAGTSAAGGTGDEKALQSALIRFCGGAKGCSSDEIVFHSVKLHKGLAADDGYMGPDANMHLEINFRTRQVITGGGYASKFGPLGRVRKLSSREFLILYGKKPFWYKQKIKLGSDGRSIYLPDRYLPGRGKQATQ